MSSLLDHRLILLSGKGGVGKTTLAISLALLAARQKKRTLIVEMNSTERVAPFFGFKEIGHKEIPLAPYLTGINLDPKECFEEYVLMRIKFKTLFDAFVNNRFVTFFLNAIPGFNELLMIGKIYDLERQKKGFARKDPQYDLIIVDGPATGHGVSTFEVPNIVKRAVRVGPLHTQSVALEKLLKDENKTIFCPVTLAEEMPVVETLELMKMIEARLGIKIGPIFVNGIKDKLFTDAEVTRMENSEPEVDDELYPYFAYSLLQNKRADLNAHHVAELKKQTRGKEVILLPFLTEYETSAETLKPLVDKMVEDGL